MAALPGLEWTFNTVAEQYDQWSPHYPAELYAALFAYQPIGRANRALEVGIGTGQATKPVLDTGCELVAVELGDELAKLARRNFASYERFSVENLPFQDYAGDEGTFDLVYSARAFHWIPEAVGYPKVFSLLKPGGAFARFASHPYYVKEEDALNRDIQKVYDTYMTYSKFSPEYTEEDAARRSAVALKYGFQDAAHRMFYRVRTYSADDYIALIGVYSDHIVLEQSKREGFYRGIREAILKHGGTITLKDTIELNLARKP